MASTSHHPATLAARLLGDHKDHNNTDTATATLMAQSADPGSSTTTNLFPTTTAGRGDSVAGPGSANVYYLVFLGVLVIILLLAACLAFRAYRMRRRYRTATQIALARGDPLPMQLRDEYWGLAGLTGFHTVAENGTGGAGMITGDRGGKKGRWERIPKLEEAETEGFAKGYKDELFEDITPVTLHSLLSPPDPKIALAEALQQHETDLALLSPSSRARRFRMPHLRRLHNEINTSSISEPIERSKPGRTKLKEIDREIKEGEEMRLAVVIQMPTQDQDGGRKRQSWGSDEEDEEVGWETGMELGVWEGSVGR